ncbi:MAG: class I SAM-dependent methyltransferase [Gammaproteobacteria bacterium]|nr:class I SAM-dependent methyltransferase [Gammaproteobacteria bacterium]
MTAGWSEASEKNKDPILAVLRKELPTKRLNVLEIGSGIGQHAVFFAEHLPQLDWQTSDLIEHHEGITARVRASRLKNAHVPRELDVKNFPLDRSYDVVFTANTSHIMSIDEVRDMFAGVAEVLEAHGLFVLYGPVNRDGEFTSESNAQFDHQLRARAAHMGIRDDRQLDQFANDGGLSRVSDHDMPANNRILIWQRL